MRNKNAKHLFTAIFAAIVLMCPYTAGAARDGHDEHHRRNEYQEHNVHHGRAENDWHGARHGQEAHREPDNGHYYHNGSYYHYHHNGSYYNYYHHGEYYRYFNGGAYFNYFYNGAYYNRCTKVPAHHEHGHWVDSMMVCQ